MNVLVLGAYGLIGRDIVRALAAAGHRVTGLVRTAGKGSLLPAGVRWIAADIARLTTAEAWAPHIGGCDAIVNASGALQTGLSDRLGEVQQDAIVALIDAASRQGVAKFVQISAPGAEADATTEFMRTKAAADDALRRSPLDWTILKPGLVIAATAYGGTSLLRMLAAVPFVQPITLGRSRVQTVDVADVARAATRALDDPALSRRAFDLVEPVPHTLLAIVLAFRQWLGFPPPRRVIALPRPAAFALARVADAAGWLGWRAPLRTTALRVLADDVVADAEPWRAATGETLATLAETLARMPATRQERSFARTELVFPLAMAAFAAFWIGSGLIGLWQRDVAAALIAAPLGPAPADAAVIGGALLDIAVGGALLLRHTFRRACLAAAALAVAYLAGGTLLTPALWADPLGPLAKAVPVILLALMLAAHAEER